MFFLRVFCFFFLFFIATQAHSEQYKYENITMDEQYFAREKSTGKAVTGMVTRNKSGKKMRDYFFAGGVLQRTVSYDTSGKIVLWETPYKNGSRDGEVVGYYEDGAVRWRIPYVAGTAEGLRYEYYNTGEVKSIAVNSNDKHNGAYYELYKDGSILFEEAYRDGNIVKRRVNYAAQEKYPPSSMGDETAPGAVAPSVAQSSPRQLPQTNLSDAPVQPVQKAAKASDKVDKDIAVEAEGIGETKLAALKNAWAEAVRLGIGMYLTSKTTLIDDEITEELVTHSRGRVNAYEEISADKGPSGWVVKIKARIEKDILQEAAVAVNNKSVTLSDEDKQKLSNAAANNESEFNKKRTAEELLSSFMLPEDLSEFFIFNLNKRIDGGKLQADISIEVNDKIFNKYFVNELCKLLDQVAIKKQTISYDKEAISHIKKLYATDTLKNPTNGFADVMYRRDGKIYKKVVLVALSKFKYNIYTLEEKHITILENIVRPLITTPVVFKIDIEVKNKEETIDLIDYKIGASGIMGMPSSQLNRSLYFFPSIVGHRSNHAVLKSTTEIPLTSEQMMSVTALEAAFQVICYPESMRVGLP